MNKERSRKLAQAGGIICVGLGATLANKLGYIDGDTPARILLVFMGLMIVWEGNRLPKTFVSGVGARRAKRIGGWVMVLSGLVYTGLWAAAPFSVAAIGGCGAIVAGLAVRYGYCLSLRSTSQAI